MVDDKPLVPSAHEGITLETLSADPYPIYRRLRRQAPVAWIPALNMWLVTRYADVRRILMDPSTFVTGTSESLLFETFGEHMLTIDGAAHRRYRDPSTVSSFMPGAIRDRLREKIAQRVDGLIDEFVDDGQADLRTAFASRLPVLIMLDLFGLPESDETLFRSWYDSFEAALANHARSESVRERAAKDVNTFHQYFQRQIEAARSGSGTSLLNQFLAVPEERRLTDAEVRRNALIIFFGGISTVEALILNTVWALLEHQSVFDRVKANPMLTDAAIEETMRWLSPVQSATRHVSVETELHGATIARGATVNCMLASANRDEEVFEKPDYFVIERPNLSKHLGFATGPHLCLGRHLAKEEARTAVNTLIDRLPNMTLFEQVTPTGHEFRQPKSLKVEWGRGR